jgi:hypothetical protein
MSHHSPIPTPIVDSFKEKKVTELRIAQSEAPQLFREPALSRS